MAVLATAVWRVRPSGVNTNGGGYDSGISGAATDYSQQNAAQASGTNGATTGAGATTFTDSTAGAFTALMIGNCIQIASGTNFQAGFYFVTAFTNANSVVLDRTPTSGGAGSAGVWKLGGGWADFWTNTTSTGPLITGNVVYILGSGTPNSAAYTYDYTIATSFVPINGLWLQNDPSTPGFKTPPDTTGGMPTVKWNFNGTPISDSAGAVIKIIGIWVVATTTSAAGTSFGRVSGGSYNAISFIGCVFDQFGQDVIALANTGTATAGNWSYLIGSEVFSSVGAGTGSNYAVSVTGIGGFCVVDSCNIHDCIGGGVVISGLGVTIAKSIIAKCHGDAINENTLGGVFIEQNTIDGNTGNGITIATGDFNNYNFLCYNNIISNHTGVGKFGIAMNSGSANANVPLPMTDYNTYYNNTADLQNQNYGSHDTHGGSNPYVGQGTENYTLA